MSKSRPILVAFIISALLFTSSCSKETFQSIAEISQLHDALIKEFKQEDVQVKLWNARILQVSFINSSFNNLDEPARKKKAAEIVLFVNNNYRSVRSIERVDISFVASENYLVVKYTSTVASYSYPTSQLRPDSIMDPAKQRSVVATYNAQTKETAFYLSRNLQLNDAKRGVLMLFPHFELSGDRESGSKAGKPEFIVFDFSTTAKERMFPDNPKLIILVDSKEIFSGTARTKEVMGTRAEGSVNEFLSQEIPYDRFLRLIDGKQAKLVLGESEFDLKAEHLVELRLLRRCIEESVCQ